MRQLRLILALLLAPFLPVAGAGLFLFDKKLRRSSRILCFLLCTVLTFFSVFWWQSREQQPMTLQIASENEQLSFSGSTGFSFHEQDIVYYTKNGTAFHKTPDCRTLVRAMDVLSDRLEAVLHEKKRHPCAYCYSKTQETSSF